MAVIQISKIQHRRGLRVDLPSVLNEAELGWTTDTRELFIGNGALHPGNTEILTEHTSAGAPRYSYRDQEAYENILAFRPEFNDNNPLIAKTGVFSSEPYTPVGTVKTTRSYQEKFDEYVSVKDYGAVGSQGEEMDLDTSAIWRANVDLYSELHGDYNDEANGGLPEERRRVLFYPAGVYRTNKFVPLFPYARWKGEGKGKTIIFFDYENAVGNDDEQQGVIQTVDSAGQYGQAMGNKISETPPTYPKVSYPTDIVIEGITFRSNLPKDEANVLKKQIANLVRAKKVTFINCSFEFVGANAWSIGDGLEVDGTTCVYITKKSDGVGDNNAELENFYFINCETNGSVFAFNFIDEISNIYIANHDYGEHYESVKVGQDLGHYGSPILDTDPIRQPTGGAPAVPSQIKMTNSFFGPYEYRAIMVYSSNTSETNGDPMPTSSVISLYNYFSNGSGSEPAIEFTDYTEHCVSAFDTFENSSPYNCGDPIIMNLRVQNHSSSNTVLNAQDFFEVPEGIKDLYVCGTLTLTGDTKIIPTSVTNNIEIARKPFSLGNMLKMTYGIRVDGSIYSSSNDILRYGSLYIMYDDINDTPSVTDDYMEHNDSSPMTDPGDQIEFNVSLQPNTPEDEVVIELNITNTSGNLTPSDIIVSYYFEGFTLPTSV